MHCVEAKFLLNWAKFSLPLLRCCRKRSVVKLRLVPPAARITEDSRTHTSIEEDSRSGRQAAATEDDSTERVRALFFQIDG